MRSRNNSLLVFFLLLVLLSEGFLGVQIGCAQTVDSSASETSIPLSQTENRTEIVSLPVVLQAGVADDPIVTFTRSGSYAGVWSVCFEGMRINGGGSIVFSNVPNGTYHYVSFAETRGWAASPSSGQVTINGQNVTINIVFTASPDVTFIKSGDYNGVWIVCFDGMESNGGNSPISFADVPDGTYNYSVTAETGGWIASPSSGQVIVNGSDVTVNVTFTSNPIVTFTKSGSYAGVWDVCFEGMRNNGGGSIVFSNVPNGTYYYTVYAETGGWMPSPQSGTLTVSGANITVNVAFTPFSSGACPSLYNPASSTANQ